MTQPETTIEYSFLPSESRKTSFASQSWCTWLLVLLLNLHLKLTLPTLIELQKLLAEEFTKLDKQTGKLYKEKADGLKIKYQTKIRKFMLFNRESCYCLFRINHLNSDELIIRVEERPDSSDEMMSKLCGQKCDRKSRFWLTTY